MLENDQENIIKYKNRKGIIRGITTIIRSITTGNISSVYSSRYTIIKIYKDRSIWEYQLKIKWLIRSN